MPIIEIQSNLGQDALDAGLDRARQRVVRDMGHLLNFAFAQFSDADEKPVALPERQPAVLAIAAVIEKAEICAVDGNFAIDACARVIAPN